MNAIESIKRLREHQCHVSGLLLEAARRLDPEPLRRCFPIGQGSVWQTLLHLYSAEYVCLEALNGNASATLPGDLPGGLPGNQAGECLINTLEQLTAAWRELDARWDEYLDGWMRHFWTSPFTRSAPARGTGVGWRRGGATCCCIWHCTRSTRLRRP